MMGRQTGDQSQLFYLFNLERRIPAGNLLRRINPVVTQADMGTASPKGPLSIASQAYGLRARECPRLPTSHIFHRERSFEPFTPV